MAKLLIAKAVNFLSRCRAAAVWRRVDVLVSLASMNCLLVGGNQKRNTCRCSDGTAMLLVLPLELLLASREKQMREL